MKNEQSGGRVIRWSISVVAVLAVLIGGFFIVKGMFMPAGDALLAESDANETLMLEKRDEVLQLLSDTSPDFGEWEYTGGAILSCPSSDSKHYMTDRASAGNTEGWRFSGDIETVREQFAESLHALGWTDIVGTSFDEGPDVLQVVASYPGVIDKMLVQFHPGEVADGVSVLIDSACWSGSATDVMQLRIQRAQG